MDDKDSRALRGLAWFQGIFYVATGVWPLVSMATFVAVTGPKVDLWLVRAVGILVAVVGGALLIGARRRRIGPELVFLAVGCAAGLAAIDLFYALADRIWDIYLLDAAVEIALALAWAISWRKAPGITPGRS